MEIGWIEISKKKYGGIVYNEEARRVLAKLFDVETIVCESRYLKAARYLRIPESLFCLARLTGGKDIWIRDFYSTLTMSIDRTKGKNVLMIHHLDFSGFPLAGQPFLNLLKIPFYHNLRRADAIVTVSQFWQRHFEGRGFKNVYTIYNGFDISEFDFNEKEVQEFKEKHGLIDKPIIYLGNCQRAKGVVEAYRALKDLDAHFVTSGKRQVRLPAIHLDLGYRDYLLLLKASSVVVVMSKFLEGWSRTAHEAMLVKTPVVGSGKGGMRELLEEGGQIVCEDFRSLRKNVEYLLNHSEKGECGYEFAKQFTIERFNNEWTNLIKRFVV